MNSGVFLLNWMFKGNEFSAKMLFSDETQFHINEYVSKKTYRFWMLENPHQFHEEALHPVKVTVWCSLYAGGVIGRFFF